MEKTKNSFIETQSILIRRLLVIVIYVSTITMVMLSLLTVYILYDIKYHIIV